MAQAFLHNPINGKQGKDYVIVNYVDWKDTGIADYRCGSKTYNGHQGTDFTLRSFAQMDSGVNVLAAASGKVVAILDGEFDRETSGEVSKGFGNYIGIKHANKYYSYYAHLAKGSLLVKVGDTVNQGQVIGKIASSGNSTDPHLHFELWYDSLNLVDPFGNGTCGNSSTLWLNEESYETSFAVWDGGLADKALDISILRERQVASAPFVYNSNGPQALSMWAQMYGLRKGDTLKLVWLDPNGAVWFEEKSKIEKDYWYYYYWSFINHSKLTEGKWKAQLYRNNKLAMEYPFTINSTNNTQVANKINSDFLNLTLEELAAIYGKKFKIYNMAGREIQQLNTFISPGIYILTVEKNGIIYQSRRATY